MKRFCKNCGRETSGGEYCPGHFSSKEKLGSVSQPNQSINDSPSHYWPPGVMLNSSSSLIVASTRKRVVNYLIDIFVGGFVVGFVIGLFLGLIGEASIIKNANDWVFGVICMFIYYFVFEGVWQKTIGKWITRTKVVMVDGSVPHPSHILGRTLLRFIPFEPFSFLGKNPTGWHDKLSGTTVVND